MHSHHSQTPTQCSVINSGNECTPCQGKSWGGVVWAQQTREACTQHRDYNSEHRLTTQKTMSGGRGGPKLSVFIHTTNSTVLLYRYSSIPSMHAGRLVKNQDNYVW